MISPLVVKFFNCSEKIKSNDLSLDHAEFTGILSTREIDLNRFDYSIIAVFNKSDVR